MLNSALMLTPVNYSCMLTGCAGYLKVCSFPLQLSAGSVFHRGIGVLQQSGKEGFMLLHQGNFLSFLLHQIWLGPDYGCSRWKGVSLPARSACSSSSFLVCCLTRGTWLLSCASHPHYSMAGAGLTPLSPAGPGSWTCMSPLPRLLGCHCSPSSASRQNPTKRPL